MVAMCMCTYMPAVMASYHLSASLQENSVVTDKNNIV